MVRRKVRGHYSLRHEVRRRLVGHVLEVPELGAFSRALLQSGYDIVQGNLIYTSDKLASLPEPQLDRVYEAQHAVPADRETE